MRTTNRHRSDCGFKRGGMALVCVVVLGLVAALLPWWVKREQTKKCIYNLEEIVRASQRWALEYRKADDDSYSLTDHTLLKFFRGSVLPVCRAGGRYRLGTNLNYAPYCTFPGHSL